MPKQLDQLLAEFVGTDPAEALEILIELGEKLPPLSPERKAIPVPAACRVQECQTPVDLWVDVAAGRVRLEAQVPEKSPTVRGFVALLVNGLADADASEIEALPDDFLPLLGLEQTLGMTRRRGFHGLVARIKREVARQSGGIVAPVGH